MKLAETLLQRLADWRPQERETLTVGESGWTVTVAADCVDRVGCRLWEVALHPQTSRQLGDLQAWAERTAARVTGLLEPLAVIEVDAERRAAQLRSQVPAKVGEDVQYYELLLQGDGAATLNRCHTSRQCTAPREPTAFTLTHEALAKLVDDLSAC